MSSAEDKMGVNVIFIRTYCKIDIFRDVPTGSLLNGKQILNGRQEQYLVNLLNLDIFLASILKKKIYQTSPAQKI